ncbi:MAG TPA: beta-ketoacyl synthase N-terminal-like domain-containing protein [Actinocrinis sp.]|nr:beta-ketoacyl synthase N-terminal-like domain-containing protein [Actinocrinis sp.]
MTETPAPTDPADAPAVAIVGMSGRFPGAADLPQLWAALRDGVCAISDFDPADLLADGEPEADVRHPAYVPSRAVLADADRFEAQLFAFHRAEAAVLDPQHRLLLETAWNALEDAGIDPRRAPGRTAVYVGGSATEHMTAAQADPRLATELNPLQLRVLTDREFLAPWLSYKLNLDGPSMTVQTACSTSLTAIHLAAQALLLGECDAALAGGVSVDAVRRRGYRYQDGGILSPDGRCHPFAENARGTVPGSGVGVVVLRRLEDALAAGDPIRAVIRGGAVTNDGALRVGFTAPGVDMQAAAIGEAWAAAGLDPTAAQYIEMHGSGTDLGDRIELSAVTTALGDHDDSGSPCAIGSVKSNLGHLDAAAGVAGLIKVVLMLENRAFVPTANVERPRAELTSGQSPLALVTATQPWPAPAEGGPRLAGVTSVGIGGTNVHLVLEQAPELPAAQPDEQADQPDDHADGQWQLLPLSARTEAQVAAAAERLAQFLDAPDARTHALAPTLADVALTLQTGRAALDARGCVVVQDLVAAIAALRALASSPSPSHVIGQGPDSLNDLAAAWLKGETVAWPTPDYARRVHLPTYPFAGEHFGAYSLVRPAASPTPTSHTTPETQGTEATETAIARLLADSLGLKDDGDLDLTFFGAGGDSLAAIHLADRLEEQFGTEVPLELFLDQLTLRELATSIVDLCAESDAPDSLLGALLDEVELETGSGTETGSDAVSSD